MIVILGVVSAVGSSFIVSTLNSYKNVQERGKLLNRGRLVVEQITRQIRLAAPNSVRVSGSGNCVEFLPLVAATHYLGELATAENGAPAINSLTVLPFTLNSGQARHAIIAGLDTGEIYSSGSPNARVNIAGLVGGPSYSALTFSANHIFLRGSVSKRIFISDQPLRVCLQAGSLIQYSNYAFSTAALTDADPGGNSDLMAEEVSTAGQAFSVSSGTQDVNSSLAINLNFLEGANQITLRQEVLIRNVP